MQIVSHAPFPASYWIRWKDTAARRYWLATTPALDALFDRTRQISSTVEIIEDSFLQA
jgi:hypothetical protein